MASVLRGGRDCSLANEGSGRKVAKRFWRSVVVEPSLGGFAVLIQRPPQPEVQLLRLVELVAQHAAYAAGSSRFSLPRLLFDQGAKRDFPVLSKVL